MASPDHLCVLVHGLWGNPNHLKHLRETLQEQHSENQLHILVVKSNADSHTYDGIEVGGERIAHEIEEKIQELKNEGSAVKKISFAGYSMGGLVTRYAIGLLYKSGLFDGVEPVNFSTFATPHIGIRTPNLGYRAYLWNVMGPRTLSTSGQQMFTVDNFRNTGRPLLSILADPSSIFVKGLRLFKNKYIYANTLNDRSVPYYTACFSRYDEFVDLDLIDVHYLPGQSDPVLLDPTKWVTKRNERKQPDGEYWMMMSPQTRSAIPFYAFLCALLPIALPTFLLNSVYQTYQSAKRVKLHETGELGLPYKRYRIPLLEEAQAVQDHVYERLAGQQREDYLPTPPPEPSTGFADSSDTLVAPTSKQMSLSKQEAGKDTPGFPVLAMTDEQFQMIDNLDALGITKYRAHIQRHRHTHAAIVVRMQKPAFDEGRVVVKHWAENFEV